MFHRAVEVNLYRIGLFGLLVLLLVACTPGATATLPANTIVPPMPTQIVTQKPTEVPTVPTEVTPSTTQAAPETKVGALTVDIRGVAQNTTIETIPAIQKSENSLVGALPQYVSMTLAGYPINSETLKPQIFVYPTKELADVNETAGKQVDDLKALLESHLASSHLPFMPLKNAVQAMHVQVNVIDFKNGKGISYLTQYAQGMVPINNQSLFYTFQGLTSDGQYYVAAVFPVNFPALPNDNFDVLPTIEAAGSGYSEYISSTAKTLNDASSSEFTPDLAKLDAMMSSIEVK